MSAALPAIAQLSIRPHQESSARDAAMASGADGAAAADVFLDASDAPPEHDLATAQMAASGPGPAVEQPPTARPKTIAEFLAENPAPPPRPGASAGAHGSAAWTSAAAARNDPQPARAPPAPVTTVYSADAMSRLNHVAQTKGYRLDFDPTEVSHQPPTFAGTLRILGSDAEPLVLHRSYASKREARAALAALGLPVLEALPSRHEHAAAAAGASPASGGGTAGDADDSINWIGRLLEYNNSLPMPVRGEMAFTESQAGTSFAATVRLHGYAPPADAAPRLYPNKQAARRAAARAAIAQLAADGKCAADGTLERKRKGPTSPPAPTSPAVPPFGASLHDPTAGPAEAGASDARTPSVPEQVAALATELGLGQVAYQLTLCAPAPGAPAGSVYDCEAHLQAGMLAAHGGGGGGSEGLGPLARLAAAGWPLARAEQVFGKQRAKLACAQQVHELFTREIEHRLASAGLGPGVGQPGAGADAMDTAP